MTSQPRRSLVVGGLWATSSLLVALAAVVILANSAVAAEGLLVTAFAFLSLAALALLTMVAWTLPRQAAYEWDADFRPLPAALRIPLRLGTWIGAAVVVAVNLVLTLGSGATSAPGFNARFAMSLLGAIGSFLTLLTGTVIPDAAFIAVILTWCAVVVIAFVRGCVGLVARVLRRRA